VLYREQPRRLAGRTWRRVPAIRRLCLRAAGLSGRTEPSQIPEHDPAAGPDLPRVDRLPVHYRIAERGAIAALNRPQLPGDVINDAPEIAEISLPDQGVGAAVVAPVNQIDVLPALDRRRQIGLLR